MNRNDDHIRELSMRHVSAAGGVLKALHDIQGALGCVPDEADPIVADVFNISRAEVRGIVSFYADFTRTLKAKTVVKVCAAEACQAAGGRELQVAVEAMRDDSEVEVEPVFCLGLCSCAPAAMVNKRLVGLASAEKVGKAVEDANAARAS